jgi:hypothetical protein
LPNGQTLIEHPGIELADHVGLRLVDNKPGGYAATSTLVAIAIGNLGTDDMTVARLLKLAATEPLGQNSSLILGDGALNLQQQLVVWVIRDGMVQERNFAASAAELLQKQHLIGVFAGKAVRAEDGHDVEIGIADGVAQRIQRRTIQPRAAVTLIAEDVPFSQGVPLRAYPVSQGSDLALNGLLSLLTLGGNAGIDRDAHGSSS